MACSDLSVLAAFADYGLHLGLLIQVMDDLDDIRRLHDLVPAQFKAKIKGSLPFIYTMELSPAHTQERLLDCLDSADKDRSAVDALVELLDECQAALYVMAEMEKQRGLALASLEQAGALEPYQDALAAMVMICKFCASAPTFVTIPLYPRSVYRAVHPTHANDNHRPIAWLSSGSVWCLAIL